MVYYRYMDKVLHDMGRELLAQLFGIKPPRSGKIVLSRHAFNKMAEHNLDRETIENAFRHGKKGRGGTIIHRYARYSIGLYYKRLVSPLRKPLQPSLEDSYLITTCWRGR
jgi:hypothetical protein